MPVAKCESVAELIKQRVVSGLHLGLLTYGARLPSVRDLSTEVRANPRVVMAAYRQLEAEGLVEMRERSGIFVTPKARQSRVGRADLVVETLLEGIRHGIPPIELPEIMKRGLARRARRAIVLECNDDQLFSIGEELRHDFGLDVQAVDLNARQVQPMRELELRSADFFITTSFHAADVRKLSEQHNVPCIVLTMCVELFAGVRERLVHEPVYFVVTDPRFAKKLEQIFAEAPGASNLRVLVNGRDNLADIPPQAAAYVTRITRKTLGRLPWLERILPETHVFSRESSREILSFIVRSNLLDQIES